MYALSTHTVPTRVYEYGSWKGGAYEIGGVERGRGCDYI